MYNGMIEESAYATMSIHRTQEGAYAAMNAHRAECRKEYDEQSEELKEDNDFGRFESWCVQEEELLD